MTSAQRKWTQYETDAAVAYWMDPIVRGLHAAIRALVEDENAGKGRDRGDAMLAALCNPLWVPLRPGPQLPSLWDIASYWAGRRDSPFSVDLETPRCFACGLLGKAQKGSPKARWNRSGGRLERGHLVNRARDGVDGVQNLVPLCAFCNRNMPIFDATQAQGAIDWILGGGAVKRLEERIEQHKEELRQQLRELEPEPVPAPRQPTSRRRGKAETPGQFGLW